MAEYSYTVVPGKLKELFGKIRTVGVPQKVTVRWLATIGFKSNNDRSMKAVLEQIGFIGGDGTPGELWNRYRGAQPGQALREAIEAGYADLFQTYLDANNRSNEELENFFSTRSTAGKQVISKTVSTFKMLCELADFSLPLPAGNRERAVPAAIGMPVRVLSQPGSDDSHFAPTLHIDIQIHIAPETSPELIDQIFASMAKHLSGTKVEYERQ